MPVAWDNKGVALTSRNRGNDQTGTLKTGDAYPTAGGRGILPRGDRRISDRAFRRLVAFLNRRTGILVKDYKRYLVHARLSRFVGDGKPCADFDDLADYLDRGDDPTLAREVIDSLTTNYSYFFRDRVHFEALAGYLEEEGPKQPYLRLWSAAASTGEEAYSMAMTVLDSGAARGADVKILGTDVSTRVIETAAAGVYKEEQVLKCVGARMMNRHFTPGREPGTRAVSDALKRLVAFRNLNLLSDYPFKRSMDVVFLRNVLIYFGAREKEEVLARIHEVMKPGGLLVVGLSESLVGIANPFKSMKNSVYRKEPA